MAGGRGGTRPGRGAPDGPGEPVWLVRIVLLLFFAAFAVFLAREVQRVVGGL